MAKIAFVTGGTRGIGAAIAKALKAAGYTVAVNYGGNDEAAAKFTAETGIKSYKWDVGDYDACAAGIAKVTAEVGPIDVLVNNAGRGDMGTVEEAPLDVARQLMEVHYFGTIAMVRAVVAEMRERGSGQIVNVGSVAGQIGFPALGYYSASKFALAGLTEALAAELALSGVKVTLAELGPFATDFVGNMTFNPPAFATYDMARLTAHAGNAAWNAGDDPLAGARALLAALDSPEPPVRLLLGAQGMETVRLHDARRAAERAKWLAVSRLEGLD